jgi:hypothetical protein
MSWSRLRKNNRSSCANQSAIIEKIVVEAAGVELFRVLITRNLLILGSATTAKKAPLPDPLYVYCTKCFFALESHRHRTATVSHRSVGMDRERHPELRYGKSRPFHFFVTTVVSIIASLSVDRGQARSLPWTGGKRDHFRGPVRCACAPDWDSGVPPCCDLGSAAIRK